MLGEGSIESFESQIQSTSTDAFRDLWSEDVLRISKEDEETDMARDVPGREKRKYEVQCSQSEQSGLQFS